MHIAKSNVIMFIRKALIPLSNYFAKNIKYLRMKKGIEQQKMAEDLGVSQPTLSCWENGSREPNLEMIGRIAKYLNFYADFITKDLTKDDKNEKVDKIGLF